MSVCVQHKDGKNDLPLKHVNKCQALLNISHSSTMAGSSLLACVLHT